MAVATGPRYGFRYGWADDDNDWAAADAENGMNRNLEYQEMTLWASVVNSSTNAPPGSPANGDCYIVSSAGSGAWVGQNLTFTYWNGTDWMFLTPANGMTVWNQAASRMMLYKNGAWGFLDRPVSINSIVTSPPGGPATGQAHLVSPSSPTGAFAGKGDNIAEWAGGNWSFTVPVAGLQVWNDTAVGFTHYDGAAWV